MSKTMEALREDLECTICFELSISPIYNCDNGHMVCGLCYDKFNKCAVCRENLVPCGFANRLAKKHEINLLCKNSEDGCLRIIRSTEMKEHLATCRYRPISCFEKSNKSCFGEVLKIRDFHEHLKSFHEIFTLDDDKTGIFSLTRYFENFKDTTPSSVYAIQFDGNVFLKHSKLDGGVLFCWITVIGDDKVAEKYRFVLNTPSKKLPAVTSNCASVTWNVPVIPLHDYDFPRVQQIGHFASIHWKALIPFCREAQHSKTKKSYKYSWSEDFEVIKA